MSTQKRDAVSQLNSAVPLPLIVNAPEGQLRRALRDIIKEQKEMLNETMTFNPPAMLLLKRQAIRVFPNGQRVALYADNKYGLTFPVPYDVTGKGFNAVNTVSPVNQTRPADKEDLMPLVEAFAEKLSFDESKDNPADKIEWIPFGQSLLRSAEHLEFNEKAALQNNLAMVLKHLGDYAGAKALLEKALQSHERNFGPEHPTTAVTYSNLALILRALGDHDGAKGLLEKALQSDLQHFGPDHPNTAVRYSNLAIVLMDLWDYAGAKVLLEKALQSDERNLGRDHPDTAVSYSNLGAILAGLGDYENARKLISEAYAIFRNQLGEGHPNTQAARGLLKQLDEMEGRKG